jgi:subtilisin family serine protease
LDEVAPQAGDHDLNFPVHTAACLHHVPWHLHALTTKAPPQPPYVYKTKVVPPTPIYIVDTWVDIDHPELKDRATRSPPFAAGEHLHGTHVAALAGGTHVGVNPNARIVSVQVLDGAGYGSWATILKGLEWISRQRKGIINMSLSGPRSSVMDRILALMIQNGWQIVAAAGNDGGDACTMSPGGHPHSVTVGALTSLLRPAPFSNRGKCLDFWAPGDAIFSAIPNGQYAYMSGTSMASPLVAGAWSLVPSWNRHQLVRWWYDLIQAPENSTRKRLFIPIQESCA